ncbi:PREDICTED: uncharacterized protein LOC106339951 [Brassica oleracea var. oleracea]|uniref:uncharacterized protein LOC106339951 n=1 Tax=Brassica oleracea var. oleracea TaxID=109376 RepID=UPI0006A6BF0A|nr:PREDICTED: uncharacterized protein LOC106339951 [Brassica oleracea var. oleracea]
MSKLTGVRAAEVTNPMGQDEQDPRGYQLPQFLKTLLEIHTYSISSSVNSISRLIISPSLLQGSSIPLIGYQDLFLLHMVVPTTLMMISMERNVLLPSSILVSPLAVIPLRVVTNPRNHLMLREPYQTVSNRNQFLRTFVTSPKVHQKGNPLKKARNA